MPNVQASHRVGAIDRARLSIHLPAAAWLLNGLEAYRAAPIGRVAAIETGSAMLFLGLVALSLLPPTLQPLS